MYCHSPVDLNYFYISIKKIFYTVLFLRLNNINNCQFDIKVNNGMKYIAETTHISCHGDYIFNFNNLKVVFKVKRIKDNASHGRYSHLALEWSGY